LETIERADYHVQPTDEDCREASELDLVLDGNKTDTDNYDIEFAESVRPESETSTVLEHVEEYDEDTESTKRASKKCNSFLRGRTFHEGADNSLNSVEIILPPEHVHLVQVVIKPVQLLSAQC